MSGGPWEKFGASRDAADVPSAQEAMPWAKFQSEKPIVETLMEAGGNIGPSAVKTGEAMLQPILHPIDTAENMVALLRGMESPKTMGKVTLPNGRTVFQPQDVPETTEQTTARTAPADAVGKYFKERYGSAEGFKKAWADDPVGVAMDLSTFGAAGALIPGGKMAGKAGALVDPVKAVTKGPAALVKGAESVTSHTLGHLTGTGPDAVRQAVKAGYNKETQFLDYLSGKAPLEEVVQWSKKAIANMRKQRGEQYQTAMKGLKGDPEVLDFNKVIAARDAVEKEMSFTLDVGGKEVHVPLSDTSAAVRQKVDDLINAWKALPADQAHTVEGLDAFKRKMGSILNNIPYEARADRKYVGEIYRATKDEIVQQAPVYAKVMKDYGQASEALEEIEAAMSLGNKATADTALRKLLSAMRNNANTNYGNRLKMVEALEKAGAKGLPSALAGAQMSSGLPRGLAGRNPMMTLLASMVDPHALAALPFESPSLVGRGAYKVGEIGGGIRDILQSTIIPDESVLAKIPEGTAVWAARTLNQAGKGQQP